MDQPAAKLAPAVSARVTGTLSASPAKAPALLLLLPPLSPPALLLLPLTARPSGPSAVARTITDQPAAKLVPHASTRVSGTLSVSPARTRTLLLLLPLLLPPPLLPPPLLLPPLLLPPLLLPPLLLPTAVLSASTAGAGSSKRRR